MDFVVVDMLDFIDLIDKAFTTIQRDGNNIIDDIFMFGILNKIAKKVNPFEEYMDYMVEHKKSSAIISFKNEKKVTPLDLFCSNLMFPSRRDIIQSNPMTVEVGVHPGILFRKELWTRARPPRSTVEQLEEPRA